MDLGVRDGKAEVTSVTCMKLTRNKDTGDERYGRAMERDVSGWQLAELNSMNGPRLVAKVESKSSNEKQKKNFSVKKMHMEPR